MVEIYDKTYDYPLQHISNAMTIANLEENYVKTISLIDSMYDLYPDLYEAMSAKYYVEMKLNSDPGQAREVLKNFVNGRFNPNVISQIANDYLTEGKVDLAIKWLKMAISQVEYDHGKRRELVNIYSRQKMYKEAIETCDDIIRSRPSDYETLKDLALLYGYTGQLDKSLEYYKASLQYYPFSFENNERIRELEGKKTFTDLIMKAEVENVIEEYEASFESSVLKSYNIVYDNKSMFIGHTRAHAFHREYIIQIKTDKGLSDWQSVNFSTTSSYQLDLSTYETIKADGSRIKGERNGDDVVFTQLEVGDYIHVIYSERQYQGGKTSLFVYDEFPFASYTPTFRKRYTVYAESDIPVQYKMVNNGPKPKINANDDLVIYMWEETNPRIIPEENYSVPYNDIASRVQVATFQNWEDIVQWYADLSNHQAVSDFTIRKLVKEVIQADDSDELKARKIYKFICDNIQYSSIDFRQGSYIPQKASTVYHTRIGDCKDMATLFVSMAREAGLDANLVLINTSDNGEQSVLLPSLEFNHCIVKVGINGQDLFLELTDSDLPFGHLHYYHEGAPILVIPQVSSTLQANLTQLKRNSNFLDTRIEKKKVKIGVDLEMHIDSEVVSTGSSAASICGTYYHEDDKKRFENKKSTISSYFESPVNLNKLEFEQLQPLDDTARHSFGYDVTGDVMKVGSFKAVKIPFAVTLLEKGIIQQEPRVNDLYFKRYEEVDIYEDEIIVSLEDELEFLETPKEINILYENFKYNLNAELLSNSVMKISRTYVADRQNVSAEDYDSFINFVNQVIEAERTQLIFK